MILAHRVALNNIWLDELDERINIKAINEGAGKETISAQSAAGGYGQRVTGRHRDTLDVTVQFSLLIGPDNMQERSTLLEKINGWAAEGGYLKVNYKAGRRLNVLCVQAPGAGDQYEWTTVYQITFRAYGVPFWEDDAETYTFGRSADTGRFTLTVPGNTETVCNIQVLNVSGATINSIEVTVAGKQMVFTNLGLGGGQTLNINHVDTGKIAYLEIKIGSTSVMHRRTGVDDFIVKPGQNAIGWTATRAVTVTAGARGRYL